MSVTPLNGSLSPSSISDIKPGMLREINQYTKEELYRYLEEIVSQYEEAETLESEEEGLQEVSNEVSAEELKGQSVNQLLSAAQVLQREVFGIISQFKEINQQLETKVNDSNKQVAIKEANLSALIENTTDMILSIDLNKEVLVVNKSLHDKFLKLFGVSIKEGTCLDTISPDSVRAQWEPMVNRALMGEAFKEIRVIDYKEQSLYFELSFNPIRDRGGNITGVSFFGKDITDRESAQRAVAEQQQLLASINYSIKEGIFRVQPGKGILYVNKAFAEMFGYDSVEEVHAVDPYHLYVDPKRRDHFVSLIQKTGYFINEEVQFRRKDGSTFWGLISSILSHDNEGNILHDGAVRDITELKETKRQLEEQNKALIKVNQELDSFVYSTSHDLRAPLVSVKGLVDVARLADSEEERNMYFQLMDQSIEKLDNFIKDIISFSRNARTQTQYSEVDIELVAREAFKDLLYQEGVSNMEMKVVVEPPKSMLRTDRTRLAMILNNLISNSIRYRDQAKTQSCIEIVASINEKEAQIRVTDNGQGIGEKILPHIFKMFYRGNQLSKGTGIGLYIVKETAQKLGGSISVDSTEGKGTTFTLHIPQMLEQ